MAEYDFRGGLPRERALLAAVGLLLLADGAPAQAGTTERVSVGPHGEQANGDSFNVGMSANGRFVAFASYATNIVPGRGDASVPQIFVHDRQTGRNEEVSVGPHGVQCEVPCFSPAVSNDGRFVAFFTRSANLVPGGTNGQSHVFVRDRELGRTELVSVGPNGVEGDGNSELTFTSPQQMTDDGRFVVFSSTAANLIPGDTNGRACSSPPCSDVFVRDRRTARTERVSLGPGGRQARGDSLAGVISASGRFVAFASDASNLVPH